MSGTRHVVITGGASGIGLVAAVAFAAGPDTHVVLNGRNEARRHVRWCQWLSHCSLK